MHLLNLLHIDVKTLIAVLFWYNLLAGVIIVAYWATAKNESRFDLLKFLTAAKILQSITFFLIFFRGSLPNFISVNIANSLLFTGLSAEGLSIYEVLGVEKKWTIRSVVAFLCTSLIFFNVIEYFYPNPGIRVITSSGCVFAILLMPSLALLFHKNTDAFRRSLGVFYAIVAVLQLPRMLAAAHNPDAYVFTNSIVQSIVFLSLITLGILSSTTFLLLMKESADKTIKMLADTDYLTKLLNRYSFLRLAECMFGKHKQGGRSFAALFLDLDKFKDVNDRYGHIFGDRVLIRFSDILMSHLREGDLACRYGGEEFVVVLPNSDRDIGCAVAERILHAVGEARFEDAPDFRLTTSIGVSGGIPAGTESLSDYLEEADKMLYKAKANGRNRIEVSGEEEYGLIEMDA